MVIGRETHETKAGGNVRREIGLPVALVLLSFLLAGCGGMQQGVEDPVSEATQQVEKARDVQQQVEDAQEQRQQ